MYLRIKQLRKILNMTQREFADALNVKRSTISTWEAPNYELTNRSIINICEKFNINDEWLRTGAGEIFTKQINEENLIELDNINLYNNNQIPKRIKELRKVLNLTQKEFSESLSVTRSTVATWETVPNVISRRSLLNICNTYNVNKNWLLTGEGEIFINLTDIEFVTNYINTIYIKDDSFQKRLINTLTHLNTNEWQSLENIYNNISANFNTNNKTKRSMILMPQPKENLYTVDYINSLPEDERAELIDGVIYNMTAPKRIHQKIVSDVCYQLRSAIDSNNGDCEVYPAPFGVKLDDYNYFEPDVSLICDKRKLTDDGCTGVPELIMEVVSPSSGKQDYVLKLNKYINAGVFEYWIIDPKQKHILIYTRSNNYVAQTYKITDEISVEIIKNCTIKLDLF